METTTILPPYHMEMVVFHPGRLVAKGNKIRASVIKGTKGAMTGGGEGLGVVARVLHSAGAHNATRAFVAACPQATAALSGRDLGSGHVHP